MPFFVRVPGPSRKCESILLVDNERVMMMILILMLILMMMMAGMGSVMIIESIIFESHPCSQLSALRPSAQATLGQPHLHTFTQWVGLGRFGVRVRIGDGLGLASGLGLWCS